MSSEGKQLAEVVKDPVCGMTVNPATAKHKYQHAGKDYFFCCGGCVQKFAADPNKYLNAKPSSGLVTLGAPAKVKDPVCGMDVDPAKTQHKTEHAGKVYSFCSAGCVEKFRANPEKHLKPVSELTQIAPAKAAAATAYVCPMCPEVRETKPAPCPKCGMALEPETPVAATKTEYTCPMHPEIVRPGPGSCPICGMALEPRTVTAQDEENPELRDMTRRFWISVLLTVPLLGIAMADMLPGMPVKSALPSGGWRGSSWCWRLRWCCGRDGRFSSGAGRRSSTGRPTCSR